MDPERAAEAVKVIADELVKLWEGVSPEELEKAKRLTKGRTMLRMEESRAVAMSIGAQELIKGEIEGIDEMLAAMDAVTLDDIRDVAKRVIRSDKTALSLVGPFDDDAPFLEALQF